jgi:hypothetical protein
MRSAILGLLAALSLACGGDDGSALDDDRRLSDLSTSEARSVCKEILGVIEDADWRGVARLGCAFAEALQPQCSDARIDSCVSQAVSQIEADPAQCDEVSDSEVELEACDATVGELGTCLRDLIGAVADLGAGLTCATLDDLTLEVQPPASCSALESRCPGLIGTE